MLAVVDWDVVELFLASGVVVDKGLLTVTVEVTVDVSVVVESLVVVVVSSGTGVVEGWL